MGNDPGDPGSVVKGPAGPNLASDGGLQGTMDRGLGTPPLHVRGYPELAEGVFGNIPGRLRWFVGRDREMRWLRDQLLRPEGPAFVMMHGPSGTGKSELALEFARRHAVEFPDGCYFLDMSGGAPSGLLKLADGALRTQVKERATERAQYESIWSHLVRQRVLFIYDELTSVETVRRWLPVHGMARAIGTSSLDIWQKTTDLHVGPMTAKDAETLLAEMLDSQQMLSYGRKILKDCEGLPALLLPMGAAVKRQRGKLPGVAKELGENKPRIYRILFSLLTDDAVLLLKTLALFNHAGTRRSVLASALEAGGVTGRRFTEALDLCLEHCLVSGHDILRWPRLLTCYILQHVEQGTDELRAVAVKVRQMALAASTGQFPARHLASFNLAPEDWNQAGAKWGVEVLR